MELLHCETKKILLPSDIERVEMKKQFTKEALKFALETLKKQYT